MDEKSPTPPPAEAPRKKQSPWGLIIGLLLILSIVVAGAYFAFSERYNPSHSASSSSSQ